MCKEIEKAICKHSKMHINMNHNKPELSNWKLQIINWKQIIISFLNKNNKFRM